MIHNIGLLKAAAAHAIKREFERQGFDSNNFNFNNMINDVQITRGLIRTEYKKDKSQENIQLICDKYKVKESYLYNVVHWSI